MKKVSVIIVNWNGLHHLKKMLPSLLKMKYSNYEIILVDNKSTDGSINFVEKKYPDIKIVECQKNHGFAAGNNKGLEYATGEYILLLNNDTIVNKNFLNILVGALERDPSIAVAQSKILSMDDNDRLDSVGAFLTNTGFLYHYGYLQKNYLKFDQTKYLYTAKGACLLIRKKVVDEIGLFDKDFFAYFEETDFCHRVWIAGYKVVYVPDAIIYHKIGGTSNHMNNAFIQYHSFKNRINSYLKNLSGIELIKIMPLHIFLCEVSAVLFLLKKKPTLFLAINSAILYNIRKLPKTLKVRKIIQSRIRKIPDSELLSKLKVSPDVSYYIYLFSNKLNKYKSKKNLIND